MSETKQGLFFGIPMGEKEKIIFHAPEELRFRNQSMWNSNTKSKITNSRSYFLPAKIRNIAGSR